MGLSEREQRVLEELERGLYEEDARFAQRVSSGGNLAGKVVAGVLLAVIGLSVLVFAVIIQIMIIGLVAFALMLGGLVLATSSGANAKPKESKSAKVTAPQPDKPKRSPGSFFEDRWDKRSGS
jgi:predicted lipid-binding transport protein (Tim44 family)